MRIGMGERIGEARRGVDSSNENQSEVSQLEQKLKFVTDVNDASELVTLLAEKATDPNNLSEPKWMQLYDEARSRLNELRAERTETGRGETARELPDDVVSIEAGIREEQLENVEVPVEQVEKGLMLVQNRKVDVANKLGAFFRGTAQFELSLDDPEWLIACGEVLEDVDITTPGITDAFKSAAETVRENVQRLIRGQRTDANALAEMKRNMDSVMNLVKIRGAAERSSPVEPGKENPMITKLNNNDAFEKQAFSDFRNRSSNGGTEKYWKKMKRFVESHSSFGAAQKVVDDILQRKDYNNSANSQKLEAAFLQKEASRAA